MPVAAPGPGSERVPNYVIVGNGIAGVTAAEVLRMEDGAAHITVIADDPFPVYYRPALKDYLAGRVREDRLWARPSSFYQDARVRFLPERVVGIRPEQHLVQLQSGRQVGYGKLLLANGARASRLNCPGVQLAGVTTLRTVADYQAVLGRLSVVRRVVVSGSGTLALESIETLRHRGYEVTHLLRRRTIWSEILDPIASDLVLQQERRDGVDVRLEEEIAEITGKDGQVSGVVTSRGEHIPCEMVLIAIGIEPLIDFIRRSGIAYGRGVQVDETMRTSAPDVYAAGDVLEVRDPVSGRVRVLGQWYPAIQQAQAAAYSMLGLLDTEHRCSSAHFYNATFLYGLDFASAGVTQVPQGGSQAGFQELVAEPEPRSYRKVILKDSVAVGMLALGNRKNALTLKRAIDHGVNLLPVVAQLFDDDFQLNAWLDRQDVPPPLLNVRRAGEAAVRRAAYRQGAMQFIRPETIGLKAIAVTPRKPRTGAVVGIEHRPDVKPLTEEKIRFEIDMCIGCDRCMHACPVPLSASITIADLNRATISNEISRPVALFTEDCVMCGSCVPVCPVDNHRDLLMLSLKQRLGISWNGQVDLNRILDYLPPGWNIPLLLSRLREQPMFRESQLVPDNYLLHLAASSKLLTLVPGTTIMREGEFGRELYIILEGRIELSSAGFDGRDLPVAILQRGEYVGEHGLLTGQQRHETARAQTPSVVLEVPEQAMQRLMELVPSLRTFFSLLDDTRSIESILKRMALFSGVDEAGIHAIAAQAQVRHYGRDERLFSEDGRGQPARETLHILLEGFVKVARRTLAGTGHDRSDERIIAYRQHGDYFAGGLDMPGDRRAVTVTAITRTRVAEISRQALVVFFARYPEVGQRFQERLCEYHESALVTGALGQSVEDEETLAGLDGLHALVGDGVVEGTGVLVIDLDKCIHCSECEEACARRHGHSRMNRKGMVVGNISIATACRQCQDPVCMLCSRAGIARMPGGEVYITESCIGCGICAERCPYDNISIVPLDDGPARSEEEQGESLFHRVSRFFSEGAGKKRGYRALPIAPISALSPHDPHAPHMQHDGVAEMRKKIAIKCDLCAGYSNQACVQACPTGAAMRVQPIAFFGSTEEILRRRTQ